MKLSDFETLTSDDGTGAHEYFEENWIEFGSGKLRGRLGKYGLYSIVKAGGVDIDTNDAMINAQIQEICTMLYDNITCGDPLDVSPYTVDGQLNRASIEFLIANYTEKSDDITSLRDEIYDECCVVSYPFADKTESDLIEANGTEIEELIIEDFSVALTKITLSITNSIDQATTVTVQQRLSADGEAWDEWEDCQHIHNVKSNVITYKASIAATTANCRQVRFVSKRNLGMSYVISD